MYGLALMAMDLSLRYCCMNDLDAGFVLNEHTPRREMAAEHPGLFPWAKRYYQIIDFIDQETRAGMLVIEFAKPPMPWTG